MADLIKDLTEQANKLGAGAKQVVTDYAAWAAKQPTVKTMGEFLRETGRQASEDVTLAQEAYAKSNAGQAINAAAGKTWEAAQAAGSGIGDFVSKNGWGIGAGVLVLAGMLVSGIGNLFLAALTAIAVGTGVSYAASYFSGDNKPKSTDTTAPATPAGDTARKTDGPSNDKKVGPTEPEINAPASALATDNTQIKPQHLLDALNAGKDLRQQMDGTNNQSSYQPITAKQTLADNKGPARP